MSQFCCAITGSNNVECNDSISSRDDNPMPVILKLKKNLIYGFPKFHRIYIFNKSAFLVIYCIVLLIKVVIKNWLVELSSQ